MLGCSKVTNFISSIILVIVLSLITVLGITLYTTSAIITDKENPKRWLKSDELRDNYVDYLADQLYSDSPPQFLEDLIGENEFKEFIKSKLSDEWVDKSIDLMVDGIYRWLEGDLDAPSLKFNETESENLINFEKVLEDKLGELAKFINVDEVNELTSQVKILNLSSYSLEYIPKTYQKLKDAPRKFAIAGAVVTGLLFLSSNSIRNGLFNIGVSTALSGASILYGPRLLSNNPQLLKKLPLIKYDMLPKYADLPPLAQNLLEIAAREIMVESRKYALLLLLGGVALIVATQFAIRTVEYEEDEE